MLFAHITDIHLPLTKAKPYELISKRVLSYLSWHLKRKNHHIDEVTNLLLEDMRSFKPDHICVTGDITNLGLPSEMAQAKVWLDNLAPVEQISFVPGNHDALVYSAEKRIKEFFGKWMISDDSSAELPFLQVKGNIAFIGVDSAIATKPFSARGKVGKKQMARLEKILQETKEKGLYRVVLIHHPPLLDMVEKKRKSLIDAPELEKVLERSGAELVIHGHNHIPIHRKVGQTDIFGAGSASMVDPDGKGLAHYSIYSIDDNNKLTVEHRVYDLDSKKFVAYKSHD